MQIEDFVSYLESASDTFGQDAWISFIVGDFEIPGPDTQLVTVDFSAPEDTAGDYVVLSIYPDDNGDVPTIDSIIAQVREAQFEFVSGRVFLSSSDADGNVVFAHDVFDDVGGRCLY